MLIFIDPQHNSKNYIVTPHSDDTEQYNKLQDKLKELYQRPITMTQSSA
jgi:hypothetical protein